MNLRKSIKSILLVTSILLTGHLSSEAEVRFYIKQIQKGADGEDGVQTDVYVVNDDLLTENKSSSGLHTSELVIGEYGSNFYLYVQGLNNPDGAPELLDEKFISHYVASADLEITSADPYSPPRTRVDQPYTVTVKSWNRNWADAQSTTNSPLLGWNPLGMGLSASYNYEEDSESHDIDLDTTDDVTLNNIPENTPPITLKMTTDGYSKASPNIFSLNKTSTSISPIIPTDADIFPYTELSSVRGVETYKIHAQSGLDVNDNVEWETVAQKSIRIWPHAQAALYPPEIVIGQEGISRIGNSEEDIIPPIVDGQLFTRSMPNLKVVFWDLYPNSTTYVTIYKGDPSLLGSTSIVPVYTSEIIKINQDIPLCDTLPISAWGEYITEDGTYTMEVSTITPFNNGLPERLLAVSFTVDRTIEFVGSTTTSE